MYKSFDLTLFDSESMGLMNIGEQDYNAYNRSIDKLRNLFLRNLFSDLGLRNEVGELEASSIKEKWFPHDKNYDVFISHSHKDIELAKKLACWLKKEFNLNAFIDSTVWGYADDLLRQIDDEYCVLNKSSDSKKIYDYDKRNYTTTHVHLILVSALREMIDSCECLIFLNTGNSVKLSNSMHKETDSPWIYDELQSARFIRKRKGKREIVKTVDRSISIGQENNPIVNYDVDKELLNLKKLNVYMLIKWQQRCSRNKENGIPEHPLDVLYKLDTMI
ncbi:TIR domain-containing protein [Limosilactobacillus reuteri]|uniref:toll/interleukin-1 receptor domain-containing protein n=1 Tax=Limosilactobacillus reuteri TaxID=1598 RepID=UPI0005143104|nr:toll/interleukin-1 receptor domain-containing protein [Limosilactobacillus reuteri]KGE71315.1 hypothetical protein HN00_09625 [Limosilactobacillus reuteri]